jgi:uncharacterized protein
MRYRVSGLLRAEIGVQWRLAIDEPQRHLGADLTVDFLRGQLSLTRTDQHILVAGLLKSAITAECVRCLDAFRLPLQIQIEEMFALNPGPRVADPAYVVDLDGSIDLTYPVREHILLTQPIKPVCRPDCKGLCINCGKNLNEGPCECDDESIDPRLAALKALL